MATRNEKTEIQLEAHKESSEIEGIKQGRVIIHVFIKFFENA
jgi:hypothetical protein